MSGEGAELAVSMSESGGQNLASASRRTELCVSICCDELNELALMMGTKITETMQAIRNAETCDCLHPYMRVVFNGFGFSTTDNNAQ